jgi:hypothetical protein
MDRSTNVTIDRLSDQELREMVRASIARVAESTLPSRTERPFEHASFARLPLLRSGDDDGRCLIEPAVRCNHCGYCLSYGH